MEPNLEQIEQWLHRMSLVVPPLPNALVPAMRRRSECLFSSRAVDEHPYDFSKYAEEALDPELADYVLVAHAGHGASSYAISYYVAWRGLRILLQLAWGGMYMDSERAGERICDIFNRLHELWPSICARDSSSRPQLLVASSDFYGRMLARGGIVVRGWEHSADGAQDVVACLRDDLGLDAE